MIDLSYISNYPRELDRLNKAVQLISERNLKFVKGFEQLNEQFKAAKALQKYIEDSTKPIRAIAEYHNHIYKTTFQEIGRVQQQWLNLVQLVNLGWTASSTAPSKQVESTFKLIMVDDNQVIFNLSPTKLARSKTSIHFLLLLALIFKSDETGYLSYEDIMRFIEENGGRTKRKNKRDAILDAKRDIFRFLGIPNAFESNKLIKVIEGKGLKLYNPVINKEK